MNREKTHLLLTTLLCVLLSGCAGQRWTGPLPDAEQAEIRAVVAALQQAEEGCPAGLHADAQLFWESPLDGWAVAGYLQMLSPSFVKFVVSNPLGQPVYAFARSGDRFQILQPRQYRHIRGNIKSLAGRQQVPQILVQGDWFAYLTGRLPVESLEGVEIHNDTADGTVWLRLSPADSHRTGASAWLHLNPAAGTVLGYLFLDNSGKTVAAINYGNQGEKSDSCAAAEETMVTELPWGAKLRIEMKNVSGSNQFSEKDFSLPVPAGYTTQLRP